MDAIDEKVTNYMTTMFIQQGSFDHVTTWIRETESYCTDKAQRVLVGNKTDMADYRVVTYDTAKVGVSGKMS